MTSEDSRDLKRGRGRPAGPGYLILDPLALSVAIKSAYQPGRGNRVRAADVAGVSDDTLAKLERGKQSSISQATFDGLAKLLSSASGKHALLDAILPLEATQLGVAARESRRAEWRDIRSHRSGWRWQVRGEEVVRRAEEPASNTVPRLAGLSAATPERFRSSLLTHRQLEADYLVYKARALTGYAKELDDVCEEQDHELDRMRLAWYRIIAPLLDYRDTGFIERAWWELSDDEFRLFVEAGIQRERILLTRANDLHRAQQITRETRSGKHAAQRAEQDWLLLTIGARRALRSLPWLRLAGVPGEEWEGALHSSDISADRSVRPRRAPRAAAAPPPRPAPAKKRRGKRQ